MRPRLCCFAVLQRTQLAHITLEYALSVLALPRKLGAHPISGLMMEVRNGKFGPFVAHQDLRRSVPKVGNISWVPSQSVNKRRPALRACHKITLALALWCSG